MTINASEHIMLANNPDFSALVLTTFGKDKAEDLLDALMTSYEMGHEYLPVVSPIDRIVVAIQETIAHRPVEGRAQYRNGALKLGINGGSSMEDIISELPDVFVHEMAHLVHMQRNPAFFAERREASKLHFGSAIIEGLAAHAGRNLGAFSVYSAEMVMQQKVVDGLAQLMDNPDSNQYETYQEFMRGTKDFSNRGYRIGEFVIASIANQRKMSIAELMALPLDEFVDYARQLR